MCVCEMSMWMCVRERSIGVSVMPPVTLWFPPVQRHVTSPLCFSAQEDLSKNVFLFKVFLTALLPPGPSSAVCVSVPGCLYMSDAAYSCSQKQELLRCRWGCWRVCIFLRLCTYSVYRQGSCFLMLPGYERCMSPTNVYTHNEYTHAPTHPCTQ